MTLITAAAIVMMTATSVAGSADHAFAANTSGAAMAYRSGTGNGQDYPKYREWDPLTSSWGSEVELETSGSPVRFAWMEFSSVSAKRVIVVLSDDGTLDSYVCDNACTTPSSWIAIHDVVDLWNNAPAGVRRPFDIEFETATGNLVLIYDRVSTSAQQDLFYRIMHDNSTSFGPELTINDGTAAAADTVYSFVRMDARRTSGSNAIGMIALDQTNSDAIAFVWNGSSWGNQHELTASAAIGTEEAIGVAYETSSGDLMVAAGEAASVRYNVFTSSWGTSSTLTGTWNVGTLNWLRLVPNPAPASEEVFLVASGDSSDLDSAYWSGSAWTDHAEHDAAIDTNAARTFDFSWNGDDSGGIMLWGTTNNQIDFKRFTAPNTFSAQSSFADDGRHLWVQLADPPNPEPSDDVSSLGMAIDNGNDISAIGWNGGASNPSLAGLNDGITLTSLNNYESATMDFKKSSAARRSIDDAWAISDSLLKSSHMQREMSDGAAMADASYKAEGRQIGDLVTVSEEMGSFRVFLAGIADSLSLMDEFAEVSARYGLGLSDPLSFTHSLLTPFEGFFSMPQNEPLILGDGLALNASYSVSPGEQGTVVNATDSTGFVLATNPPPAPPTVAGAMPRAIIATDKPPSDQLYVAEPVGGLYSAGDGNIAALIGQADLPTYEIDSSTDLALAWAMLPTFLVSLEPSPELPAQAGFITPPFSSIPAGTSVVVPLNVSASLLPLQQPGEAEAADALRWLSAEYVPQTTSFDFALMVAIMDSPAQGAPGLPPSDNGEGQAAFFIDVRWVGNFSGPERPSDSAFYLQKPVITFSMREEWAEANGIERDGNGVPVLAMYLLDEATLEWQEVAGIQRPAGIAGDGSSYVYSAALDHFSTYAVAGESDSAPGGGGSGGSGGNGGGGGGGGGGGRGGGSSAGAVNPANTDSFGVGLSDAVAIEESPRSLALAEIEEFAEGSRNITLSLDELLEVSEENDLPAEEGGGDANNADDYLVLMIIAGIVGLAAAGSIAITAFFDAKSAKGSQKKAG